MQLGGTGIWAAQLRYGDAGAIAEAAAELDELGLRRDLDPRCGWRRARLRSRRCCGARRAPSIATGILNMWMHEPAEVAARRAAVERRVAARASCSVSA